MCGQNLPKKKRLFYYHEGVDAFVPYESFEEIQSYLDDLYDGDTFEIKFKRKDMTNDEFENLPDV